MIVNQILKGTNLEDYNYLEHIILYNIMLYNIPVQLDYSFFG